MGTSARATDRMVIRNIRFQLLGTLCLLAAGGMGFVIYLVITSPSRTIDNPEGLTTGVRILAIVGCLIPTVTLAVFGIGGLRVALIVEEAGVVIRNPVRTTKVDWTSKPKFEVRAREQVANISGPITGSGPQAKGRITYRFREIECVAKGDYIWIAATSKMWHRERVDEFLIRLREVAGRFQGDSVRS